MQSSWGPRKRPIECIGCPLNLIATGFLDPEGSGLNGVLIVGEAAGEAEANDSLPFRPYAQAGSVLERCISRAGLNREEFALWNMCACRPPGNKLEGQRYEAGAINHCKIHFKRVLDRYQPRVLLALGNVPCKWLTGMAGHKKTVSSLRGFVFSSVYDIPVVPSLHPAYIARGKSNFIPVLIRDLQYAVHIAQHGVPKDEKNYIEHPSVAQAVQYLRYLRNNPGLCISYDIETDYSFNSPDESDVRGAGKNIVQIQFSHKSHQAIVFPWIGDYIKVAAEILGLENPKWGWNNWSFDDPILKEHGIEIKGENHDLMWAWHHLQPDLPRGLQFVGSFYAPELSAWKHLSDAQPQFYGGIDVDAVSRIGERVFEDLNRTGIRRGYDKHIVRLNKVLQAMCARGFPVDLQARDQFRTALSDEAEKINLWLQSQVPDSLRTISPKAGFKVNPPQVRELAKILGVKLTKGREKLLPEDFKLTVKANCNLDCKVFEDGYERFYHSLAFLPSSDDQVKAYIKVRGYKMPTKLKEKDEHGNPKETTEKKGLERLYKQTHDEFFLRLIEYRELEKMKSTYVDGWRPDKNGRVHSEFLFAPATGQLSSRNPNIQNIPKGYKLAHEFRKCIRPKPGHVLLAFDWSAFHALMLGFEAKDPDYMLLSRLDIHSYLAGHLLKLDGRDGWLQLPIEDLAGVLGQIKHDYPKVRGKKAKPAVLGYQLGLGASKLYDMNLESYESKKDAQYTIDMLNTIFPKAAAFREDIKKLASRQGYLLSRHGYIRRFFDIYGRRQISERYEPLPYERVFYGKNGKRYKQVTGEEGEAAIAFPVQNDAHGHAKDVILALDARGALEEYGFINFIHDELLFECPETMVDRCMETVSTHMEAPSCILVDDKVAPKGLACGIEASIGRESWAEMETIYKTPLKKLL